MPMSASAERMTKVVVTNDSDMCVDGVPEEPKPLHKALREFFTWMKWFPNVVLLAHNGKRFDFPIIVKACEATDMYDELCSCVFGLVDTLPDFFKNISGLKVSLTNRNILLTLTSP